MRVRSCIATSTACLPAGRPPSPAPLPLGGEEKIPTDLFPAFVENEFEYRFYLYLPLDARGKFSLAPSFFLCRPNQAFGILFL
jgi:hypothetical protein